MIGDDASKSETSEAAPRFPLLLERNRPLCERGFGLWEKEIVGANCSGTGMGNWMRVTLGIKS